MVIFGPVVFVWPRQIIPVQGMHTYANACMHACRKGRIRLGRTGGLHLDFPLKLLLGRTVLPGICMHMPMHAYEYACMRACMHMHACMHIMHMHMHMHACMHACMTGMIIPVIPVSRTSLFTRPILSARPPPSFLTLCTAGNATLNNPAYFSSPQCLTKPKAQLSSMLDGKRHSLELFASLPAF